MVILSDGTVFNHSFDHMEVYKMKTLKTELSKPQFLLNNGEIVSEKPKFQNKSLHLNPVFEFTPIDMAQQQFKDECDINNIMKRFESTGQLPDMIKADPQFGDFTDVPSFLDALNTVNLAEAQFAALSSKVRAQFDNDPAQFLQFATDPSNGEELVKMGLASKPAPTPEPTPQKVIVVNPDASQTPPKADAKA